MKKIFAALATTIITLLPAGSAIAIVEYGAQQTRGFGVATWRYEFTPNGNQGDVVGHVCWNLPNVEVFRYEVYLGYDGSDRSILYEFIRPVGEVPHNAQPMNLQNSWDHAMPEGGEGGLPESNPDYLTQSGIDCVNSW